MLCVNFAKLKSITAYLLLAIYLPVFHCLAEGVKIPFLFDHYQEYQKEQAGNNMVSFLYDHYMLADDNDNDRTEDDKLPFRAGTYSPFQVTGISPSTDNTPLNYYMVSILPGRLGTFHNQSGLPAIWHPPKTQVSLL